MLEILALYWMCERSGEMKYKADNSKMPLQQNKQMHKQKT